MTALGTPPDLHPLQGVATCVRTMSIALDSAPDGELPLADAALLEQVVAEAAQIHARVAELRLRLARCAEQVRAEERDAASGTDAWLARLTGSTTAAMRGGLRLARLLTERYPDVRRAFADGSLAEGHVRIIVNTAEQMPSEVCDDDRQRAVASLVERAVARRMNPSTLRRASRRMLDAVDRAQADRHEHDVLAGEETRSQTATWFRMDDNGDGTYSGRFVIPDLHAHLLRTVLEHLSAPRRSGRNQSGETVSDPTVADATGAYAGLSWSESLGHAFTELCEHLPTTGLAQHGRIGATVVVHLDHERLLDGLGGAHLDSGGTITAGQARRLGCGAGIIPAVYGGQSVPLDLGRERRLHTKAQRIALSARHQTCAAEGCERPFAWCEIHHPHAWALGGRTDLTGVPLCGWHHRRAHDGRYDLTTMTSGEIRYRRRR